MSNTQAITGDNLLLGHWLARAPVGIKFALVDGQSRQVQGVVLSRPEMAYEHWVLAAIEARQ